MGEVMLVNALRNITVKTENTKGTYRKMNSVRMLERVEESSCLTYDQVETLMWKGQKEAPGNWEEMRTWHLLVKNIKFGMRNNWKLVKVRIAQGQIWKATLSSCLYINLNLGVSSNLILLKCHDSRGALLQLCTSSKSTWIWWNYTRY